jgi:hypothetical protein
MIRSHAAAVGKRNKQIFVATQDQTDFVVTSFVLKDDNYMFFLDDIHQSTTARVGQTITTPFLVNEGSMITVYY